MDKNPVELQYQIRETALHTHNEINNLKTWEKEMSMRETEYLKTKTMTESSDASKVVN